MPKIFISAHPFLRRDIRHLSAICHSLVVCTQLHPLPLCVCFQHADLTYSFGFASVDAARVLLEQGPLVTATDQDPTCHIGKGRRDNNPKGAWMRRSLARCSLARGPAFRDCSWLWPREMAKRPPLVVIARGEQEENGGGANKKNKLPLDLSVLHHRHRRKDAMKILLRQMTAIFKEIRR